MTLSKGLMSMLCIANAEHHPVGWPHSFEVQRILCISCTRGELVEWTRFPQSTSRFGSTSVRPHTGSPTLLTPHDDTFHMQHPGGIVHENTNFPAWTGRIRPNDCEFASCSWLRSFHRGDPTPSWGRRPQQCMKWHLHVDG